MHTANVEIRECVKSSVKKGENNWKIIKLSGPKSGHGRLQKVVIYEKFQLQIFDWEIFSVLDRRSLMGGGRLREVVAHGGSTV